MEEQREAGMEEERKKKRRKKARNGGRKGDRERNKVDNMYPCTKDTFEYYLKVV